MGRRFLDLLVASTALVAVSPLLLIAAIGIRLTSPGPIFYRARRIARDRRRSHSNQGSVVDLAERRHQDSYQGREFSLYKFRTMRVTTSAGEPITAWNDPRVFPFGALLRATKIDELPQLINVIKGDMALVGPRPEAPEIVRNHYTPDDLLTLQVPPGVTSPGTLHYYTQGEATLKSDNATQWYVDQLLPLKLAQDRAYIGHVTVLSVIRVILRTIVVIILRSFGSKRFQKPPGMAEVAGRVSPQPSRMLHLDADLAAPPRSGRISDKP